MRSVEQQQTTISAHGKVPRPVRVAISEAQGLLCAEEVTSRYPMPGFDQAAVDGFAVRSVDVKDAGAGVAEPGEEGSSLQPQVVLPLVGGVAAGSRTPTRLQPGQLVQVETGAQMPTLADAVVPAAWASVEGEKVAIRAAVRSGDFVRRVGDDVQPGDVAVLPGSVIGSAQVGLLAAVGHGSVLVHPRPRVAVISVGDELVDIDRQPGPGQVFDVNSHGLAAAAREAGAEGLRVGIAAASDPEALRAAVEVQLGRAEIIVITGAVGGRQGEAVRAALAPLGELTEERIAMHPGSVQGFGLLGPEKVPTFLLPANPVSALVIFEIMIRPIIRIGLGRRQAHRRTVRARSVGPIASMEGRRGFLRGQLMRDERTGGYLVNAIGAAPGDPAHLLASLAEANALVVIEESVTEVLPGDEVTVMFLAQRG